MEEFYKKLKDYLKMETEIPYEEFADYYQRFLDFFNQKYEELNREELIKGRYICLILQANSWERSRRKDQFAKKYKKITEKVQFWASAIKHRLLKEGMTAIEIDQANDALNESV